MYLECRLSYKKSRLVFANVQQIESLVREVTNKRDLGLIKLQNTSITAAKPGLSLYRKRKMGLWTSQLRLADPTLWVVAVGANLVC